MDKDKVLEKANQYADLVCENIKPQKIVLYGSYARDNWKEESDIDIAVIVDVIDVDIIDLEALLYKLRRNIDDRIEPVLLEGKEDRSGFISEILKYGQVLYDIS